MSWYDKPLKAYSKFISHNPYWVILGVVIVILIAAFFSTKIVYESFDTSKMIPDNYEVVKAFNLLEDTFGNPSSILIAIQIDDDFSGYNKIYDLRDYESIKYMDILTNYLKNNDYINTVDSLSSGIRQVNEDIIPKSNTEINSIIFNNSSFERYISNDYTMSLIRISLTDNFIEADAEKLVFNIEEIINIVNKPHIGITVKVAGEVATGPIVDREIGPDMQKTSSYSIYGIIVILILIFVVGEMISSFKRKDEVLKVKLIKIFGSMRFGLIPLSTIIIGIIWTFGYLGLTKIGLSSITSGVISMIMGIGIDFGIQTVMRFKHEIKNKTPEKAMENTLYNVFIPMATTTIATLIGFKAMGMGELTLLKDLGAIMSYGVAACFLAAITFVPAILVVFEKWILYLKKIKNKK
jgi:predicted RND superfamily exporter protein